MESYYDLLGISPDADEVVIRAAYRALMLKYHPDTNASAEAANRAQQLNEAFDVLGDPERRRDYDISQGLSGGDAELVEEQFSHEEIVASQFPAAASAQPQAALKAFILGPAIALTIIGAFNQMGRQYPTEQVMPTVTDPVEINDMSPDTAESSSDSVQVYEGPAQREEEDQIATNLTAAKEAESYERKQAAEAAAAEQLRLAKEACKKPYDEAYAAYMGALDAELGAAVTEASQRMNECLRDLE